MSATPTAEFVPATRIAEWAKCLLIVSAVVMTSAVVAEFSKLLGFSWPVTGDRILPDGLSADARQAIFALLNGGAVLLGSALAFLIWFHRAHKNLSALGGRELQYTPGWAVGGFFYPILGLVRPLQVMREVWHASDPRRLKRDLARGGPYARDQLGTPAMVGCWWATFLTAGVLLALAGPRSNRHQLPEAGFFPVAGLAAGYLLWMSCIMLTIQIITRITAWQAERYQRVLELSADPSEPVAIASA